MTTVTNNVYYQPDKNSVIDFICEDGLTKWGRKTAAEIEKEYPGAIVMNWEKAAKAKENHWKSPVEEIDEEKYWYFLECLPPVGWVQKDGAETFKMSERLSGNITGIYAKVDDRYFTFNDSIFTKHEEIMTRVMEFINA